MGQGKKKSSEFNGNFEKFKSKSKGKTERRINKANKPKRGER